MESKIKWITVIPPWVQALGIIGLIYLVFDRIEIDYKDKAKSLILSKLSNSQAPIKKTELFIDIKKDKEKERELATVALYELMANKVVIKTAYGYEITRHNTRLFNDIEILVEYELESFSLSEKKGMSLSLLVSNIKKSLLALENGRDNKNGNDYIKKIEYDIILITLKKLARAYFYKNLILSSKKDMKTSEIFTSPDSFIITIVKKQNR